ncbi:hypothetical protein [Shewanella maritima]|uniref:hypothetical protein n=1 Tax=Shewanella maritima TaxID=2520507 RepID=UPI003736A5ED
MSKKTDAPAKAKKAQQITESTEQPQDVVELAMQDEPANDAAMNAANDAEWSPEVSAELLGMDAAQQAEIPEQNTTEPQLPKTQVEQAQTLANEIAGLVAVTVESVTGRDYGLNPASVQKWAEGVAPCLVKYGLTDMGEIMNKWGVEIQAGIATASMGFGAYAAHKRYQKEDEAKANAEAEKQQAA